MVTIQSISNFNNEHFTAITIGTFDGVHIGHCKILERLINSAKNLGLKATVLTFFPHPRMVLQKDTDIKLLNTLEEKSKILEHIGLDYLVIHPFTQEFSRLSSTEFVRDILVNNLRTKKVIIGYNHRFGRNRAANIDDLISYGSTFGFKVEEITAQEIADVSVSSTKIRTALLNGDIETANTYLGYSYMLTGTVKKGKGLGKQIGYPTANIFIEEDYKLIPKNGVYVVKSKLKSITYFGMMNIGYNPTVSEDEDQNSESKKNIEVHFFNLHQDLYGQKIQIDMLYHLRDEHKFESIEALKAQLKIDKETSLSLIENEYDI